MNQWMSPSLFYSNFATALSMSICTTCTWTLQRLYILEGDRANSIALTTFMFRLVTVNTCFASKSSHQGPKGKRNTGWIVILAELVSYHGSTHWCSRRCKCCSKYELPLHPFAAMSGVASGDDAWGRNACTDILMLALSRPMSFIPVVEFQLETFHSAFGNEASFQRRACFWPASFVQQKWLRSDSSGLRSMVSQFTIRTHHSMIKRSWR